MRMSTTLEAPRSAAAPHPVARFLEAFPPNAWVFDGIALSVFYPTHAPRDVALMGASVVAEGHEQAAMMLLGGAPQMMAALQRLAAFSGDQLSAVEIVAEVRQIARGALVASGLPVAAGEPASDAPRQARCMRGVLLTSAAEMRAIAAWAGGLGTDDGAAYAQRASVLADAAKTAIAMEAH